MPRKQKQIATINYDFESETMHYTALLANVYI